MRKKKPKEEAITLPESELKVMQYIWEKGEASAKDTSEQMTNQHGWKKNTTYTVLNNLIGKGVIQRLEPGFICKPLLPKENIGQTEVESVLTRFYEGSASALFSSFIKGKKLSKAEVDEIKAMIEQYEE